MKTAMQEIAMVVDNEQDIIDVAELLVKEREQLIDAFIAGWNNSKTALLSNKANFYANKFYKEKYTTNGNEPQNK
mgnify:FL=1